MADKQRRLEAIRDAKAALEAEAADPPDPEDESGPGDSSGMRWQGRPLRGEDGAPPDRAHRNFTDPDSRILLTRDGFVQGYNGQIAVDAAYQVIVAHRLVTNSADYRALVPLVDGVRTHLGRKPREVSSDAGFANEANLAALKLPQQRHAQDHRMVHVRPHADRANAAAPMSATKRRRPVTGPIYHSDRSSKYAAEAYRKQPDGIKAKPLKSWAVCCYDNVSNESFFQTLKVRVVHQRRGETRNEARRDFFAYINADYNPQRIHSALSYITPSRPNETRGNHRVHEVRGKPF